MEQYLPTVMKNIPEAEILNVLISATPVAYIVMDKEFRIHFINDYFTELRQLDKHSTLGDKCYNLSNGGKKCTVCAVSNTIKTGQRSRILRKDRLPSGTIRYIDDFAIPLYKNGSSEFDYILEIMVNRDEEMQSRKQRDEDFVEILHVLSSLLETKDEYTAQHSKMVRDLSVRIAKAMGLSQDEVFEIDIAASLHDIGKVFISNDIINKTGKLTDEEFAEIKTHPQKSRDMLESLSGFQQVKDFVQLHHERFDNKGYPLGLGGEDIPLGARIIAVADAYDAMTSTRSYRKAMDHETAVAEVVRNSGTQFDPNIVEAFLNVFSVENSENTTTSENLKKKFSGVERFIVVEPEADEKVKSFKELHDIMPKAEFIKAIFENAPVGYVIMDDQNNVMFANSYFISVMGLQGLTLENRKCYDFNMGGVKCANCAMDRALESGKLQSDQIRQQTRAGEKYFDVYAVPLRTADSKKYVAEILIDRTEEMMLRKQHESDLSTLIKLLSTLLENTIGEKQAVKSLSEAAVHIARLLNLSEEEVQNIEIAASLCNIGMISMGAGGVVLTADEMLHKHPQKSWDILNNLSGFENVKNIILHHHEKYDGTGFPNGLKGEDIPLGARIIAIAEGIYESGNVNITKDRFEYIKSQSGKAFDPAIIDKIEASER